MMAHTARSLMLIRSWEILVLLRKRPHTLNELAAHCGVTTRTIRRDMEALCAASLPVVTSRDDIEAPTREALWSLAHVPEWPGREATQTRNLVHSIERRFSRISSRGVS